MAVIPRSPLYSDNDQETIDYIISRLPQIPELSEVNIQVSRVVYDWKQRVEVSEVDSQNRPAEYENTKKITITRKFIFKIQECAKVLFFTCVDLQKQLQEYQANPEKNDAIKMFFTQVIEDRNLEPEFGHDEFKTVLITCKKIVCYISLQTKRSNTLVFDSDELIYAGYGGDAVKITINALIKAFQIWKLLKG